jgi:hypothetical protein
MLFIITIFQILTLINCLTLIDCLRINSIDNAIGKWSLLYTSNICFTDDLLLDIKPSTILENLNLNQNQYEYDFDIKLTITCRNHFINTQKILSFITKEVECDLIDSNKINCNLLFLTSEKYIQSLGIIDFPQIIKKYNSSYQYENMLKSNVYINCDKLYIYFNNHNYIFEKIINVSQQKENIISQTFIMSNLLSFAFGKLFDNIMHNPI